jgi:hypothetical protein
MSFTRFAAVSLAASVLWWAAADAGGPLRPFKNGFWSGGAYTDDRTGAFTHCSAGVAYDSGINLFVLVTGEYHWWLGFINPKWSLIPRDRTPIRLQFDAGTPFERLATIPNGQLLLVALPDKPHLIDALRHGTQLVLEAEGRSFFFKLDETAAVMDRLTNCVNSAVREMRIAASPPTDAPPSKPDAGAEASRQQAPPPPPLAGDKIPPKPAGAAAAPPQTETPLGAVAPPSPPARVPSALPEPPGTAPKTAANAVAAGASAPAPAAAGGKASAAAQPAQLPSAAAQSTDLPGVPGQPMSPQEAASPTQTGVAKRPSVDGLPERSGAAPSSPVPAGQAGANPQQPSAAPSGAPASGSPALAFTAVNPAPPPLPAALPAQPTTATAIEEARLATDFLARARLPDARLIAADKPPALADFAAVWRSPEAAGAVKIIPAGPDVSALGIASNLIAVDPQVCRGDFTAARIRTDVADRAVFTAVLSCSEANERRVTEYFVAPRRQGGVVVFVVIRTRDTGDDRGFDRRKIEVLSRAAIEAVQGQG